VHANPGIQADSVSILAEAGDAPVSDPLSLEENIQVCRIVANVSHGFCRKPGSKLLFNGLLEDSRRLVQVWPNHVRAIVLDPLWALVKNVREKAEHVWHFSWGILMHGV
jgi:hypothetical protein